MHFLDSLNKKHSLLGFSQYFTYLSRSPDWFVWLSYKLHHLVTRVIIWGKNQLKEVKTADFMQIYACLGAPCSSCKWRKLKKIPLFYKRSLRTFVSPSLVHTIEIPMSITYFYLYFNFKKVLHVFLLDFEMGPVYIYHPVALKR